MNKNYYNYFFKIINKYNLSLSNNKPLVLFLDGKHVTSNNMYNLNNETIGSFNDYFEKTIKYFSNKYNCIALSGVDEVSFIITDTTLLRKDCNLKNLKSQDVVSVFSQKFFQYFKNLNKNTVYWHCKSLSIPNGKVISYLKYRSNFILGTSTTYFLKRKNIKDAGNLSKDEKIAMCNSFDDYKEIKQFENGRLYKNGKLIDLNSYLSQEEIIELFEIERKDLFTNFFE